MSIVFELFHTKSTLELAWHLILTEKWKTFFFDLPVIFILVRIIIKMRFKIYFNFFGRKKIILEVGLQFKIIT